MATDPERSLDYVIIAAWREREMDAVPVSSTIQPPPARRRAGGLALLSALLLLALLSVRQVGSPDAGFHLARGRAILAGHGIPRFDTLTYTVNDHADVNTSWGYDVVLALVESRGGARGMILFHAMLAGAAFWIVARTARLATCDAASIALLLLLGILMSEERLEVRPELVSYLLLAVAHFILTRHALKGRAPLWALPCVFALWANVHSLFVVGFASLLCFNLGAVARARRLDRRLLAASAAAVAAAFINPFGVRGVWMALVLATRLRGGQVFHETISEYESPVSTLAAENLGLYLLPIACLFIFAALVLLSIGPLWKERRPGHVFLALVFVPLALAMVRNAPLLAIACTPGTAWALPLRSLVQRVGLGGRAAGRLERAVLAGVALAAVLFGLRVVNDAYYVGRGRLERFGFGWNRYLLPVDAAAYAERAPLAGRMFNDLNFGGYLGYALARPVFIDGRLEVIGEDFFRAWLGAMSSADALDAAVRRYGATWIVFPYRDRPQAVPMLLADQRWRLAYCDHLAAIFVRTDAGADSVIDESVRRLAGGAPGMPPIETIPGLGPFERRGLRARWLDGFLHRQSYPVEDYALGVFHYLGGDWRGLASYSARAIQRSGGAHRELYANLGSALYALGDLDAARRCFVIALAEVPPYGRREKENLRRLLREVEAAMTGRGVAGR